LSLLGLLAVQKEMTPEIHQSWSARTFTPVKTSEGVFDDVVCNIAYHYKEHGSSYGNIADYTHAAQEYFRQNRNTAIPSNGILELRMGRYEKDGRIITFFKPKT
jgi:hypothetical protein